MFPTFTYTLGLVVPLIIGTLFLFFGGLLVYRGWRGQQQVRASQNWLSTPGVVLAARLLRHADHDSTLYEPVIEYRYEVEKTPLEGSRYAFSPTITAQANAQAMIERYPPGTPVTVYYNPNDLRDAVLERSVAPLSCSLILGAILAVVGLMACSVGGLFAFLVLQMR